MARRAGTSASETAADRVGIRNGRMSPRSLDDSTVASRDLWPAVWQYAAAGRARPGDPRLPSRVPLPIVVAR